MLHFGPHRINPTFVYVSTAEALERRRYDAAALNACDQVAWPILCRIQAEHRFARFAALSFDDALGLVSTFLGEALIDRHWREKLLREYERREAFLAWACEPFRTPHGWRAYAIELRAPCPGIRWQMLSLVGTEIRRSESSDTGGAFYDEAPDAPSQSGVEWARISALEHKEKRFGTPRA